MYTITEVFLDQTNKYRVRVLLSDNNSTFFIFDHYPTQEEVNSVVESYLLSQQPINNGEIV